MSLLARSRVLFVPGVLDASPRILTEALALGVPVVVNRQIVGGWKYVNAFTGVFFDGEEDVVNAFRECLDSDRKPRRWFMANYGPYLAGKRLLDLLRSLDPSIEESSHLLLSDRLLTLTTRRGAPSIGEA
jgi:glycosyltransferase involved in cell wall biosynthesis